MIITACTANEPYYSHAKVLLSSLAENMPAMSVALFLVNGTRKQQEQLYCANSNCNVVLMECNPSNQRDYVNTIRAQLVLRAIRDGIDVIWIDTDCIVRDDLEGLAVSNYEPATLKIMYRPYSERERTRFQNGVFSVNSKPETIELFRAFTDKMFLDKSWYQDQLWLYRLWKRRRDLIKLVPLGGKYNDWYFDDNSVIWHCKSSHFEDVKYQKEYQHYLNIADEKIGGRCHE